MAEICWRKPKILPAVPMTKATVLVALAITGGVPQRRRTGKVISVPPPAMALTAPAAVAAAKRAKIWESDIEGW